MGTFTSGIRYKMYRKVFSVSGATRVTALELPFEDTNKMIFLNHMHGRSARAGVANETTDIVIERRVLNSTSGPAFSEPFEVVASANTANPKTNYLDFFSPYQGDQHGTSNGESLGRVRLLMPGDRVRFSAGGSADHARLLIIWTEVVIGGLFSVDGL